MEAKDAKPKDMLQLSEEAQNCPNKAQNMSVPLDAANVI